jgi:cobalt/nickel transport system permease protein
MWAFGVDVAAVTAVAAAARLPAPTVLRRLRLELPFVAFAVFLPLVGGGPHVDAGPLALSQPGLWAAWNIVAKGTLGVLAAIVLTGTTPVAELLAGLDRLRVPRVLVAIAGFMVRYLDVIAGEAARLRVARLSRADDARWLWQSRAVAATAGTLFVRSYERGERVHLAMLSRGYAGTMPALDHHRHEHGHALRARWAAALPVVAAVAAAVALVAA